MTTTATTPKLGDIVLGSGMFARIAKSVLERNCFVIMVYNDQRRASIGFRYDTKAEAEEYLMENISYAKYLLE